MTLSLVPCKLNCDPQEHQWLHLKTSLHALPFYLDFFSISRTEMFADCRAKLNMFLLSAEHVFSLSPEDSAVSTSVSCYISALNISDSKTKHAARDPKPVYDKVG